MSVRKTTLVAGAAAGGLLTAAFLAAGAAIADTGGAGADGIDTLAPAFNSLTTAPDDTIGNYDATVEQGQALFGLVQTSQTTVDGFNADSLDLDGDGTSALADTSVTGDDSLSITPATLAANAATLQNVDLDGDGTNLVDADGNLLDTDVATDLDGDGTGLITDGAITDSDVAIGSYDPDTQTVTFADGTEITGASGLSDFDGDGVTLVGDPNAILGGVLDPAVDYDGDGTTIADGDTELSITPDTLVSNAADLQNVDLDGDGTNLVDADGNITDNDVAVDLDGDGTNLITDGAITDNAVAVTNGDDGVLFGNAASDFDGDGISQGGDSMIDIDNDGVALADEDDPSSLLAGADLLADGSTIDTASLFDGALTLQITDAAAASEDSESVSDLGDVLDGLGLTDVDASSLFADEGLTGTLSVFGTDIDVTWLVDGLDAIGIDPTELF